MHRFQCHFISSGNVETRRILNMRCRGYNVSAHNLLITVCRECLYLKWKTVPKISLQASRFHMGGSVRRECAFAVHAAVRASGGAVGAGFHDGLIMGRGRIAGGLP